MRFRYLIEEEREKNFRKGGSRDEEKYRDARDGILYGIWEIKFIRDDFLE